MAKGSVKLELERILADGEWHPFRELFYKAQHLVRPEVAIHYYNSMPSRGRPRVFAEPLETQIDKGKQRVIGLRLVSIGVEMRGLSNYDPNREYRSDPSRGEFVQLREEHGGSAVRALASIPEIASALDLVEARSDRLTALQRYWYLMARTAAPAEEPEPVGVAEEDGDED